MGDVIIYDEWETSEVTEEHINIWQRVLDYGCYIVLNYKQPF